jgi:uncharacterized protein (DUF2252 family)
MAVLAAQDTGRVPELLPIRYARMALSPFTFFRGAAAVMAADLAATPVSGLEVQLCGDAHLCNFGFFASPERHLVFDINDFDETLPGPWEWDVKRLAASLEVAARDRKFAAEDRRGAVEAAVRSYQRAMCRFAEMTNLEVWYSLADEAVMRRYQRRMGPVRRKRVTRGLARARTRDNLGALNRFTAMVDGRPQIVADPPLIIPIRDLYPDVPERTDLEQAVYGLLLGYRDSLQPDRRVLFDQYRAVDLARKVVGVGSVGTRCWMALMLGRDLRDPLFLQVKEAGRSVLEPFVRPAEQVTAGERVVTGHRLIQTVGDIFLGWQRMTGIDGAERDFYIRQLRDWKGGVDVGDMVPSGLRIYAELCGWTLARAHARSGDRVAIAAYLGSARTFDRAVVRFADAYADQNERDHRALLDAIAEGRVEAAP